MPNLGKIPREVFDLVADALLPNSTKNMADALLYSEKKENILWRAIFKSDEWIDKALEVEACPCLIGPTLDMIGNPDCNGPRRHHALLSINDWHGDLQYFRHLLFESLREGYRYNKAKYKVILPETIFTNPDKTRTMKIPEIVLHINDVIFSYELIELKKSVIRRLFKPSTVQTQYSFATQKKIRLIQRPDIFGIRGTISKRRHLSPICGMYLLCNGKRWQTILKIPECPRVAPVLTAGRTGDIICWEVL
jgi:hypothetical protein